MDITTAQATQTEVASFDLTQCSPSALIQIGQMLRNIQNVYITDQISTAAPSTVTAILSTFATARTAQIAQTAQVTP